MIKKFIGEFWTRLIMFFRPPVPAWLTSWYWLDRYEEWRDSRTGKAFNDRDKITEEWE